MGVDKGCNNVSGLYVDEIFPRLTNLGKRWEGQLIKYQGL